MNLAYVDRVLRHYNIDFRILFAQSTFDSNLIGEKFDISYFRWKVLRFEIKSAELWIGHREIGEVKMFHFSWNSKVFISNTLSDKKSTKKLGQNSLYLIGIESVIHRANSGAIIRTVTLVVPVPTARIERKFEYNLGALGHTRDVVEHHNESLTISMENPYKIALNYKSSFSSTERLNLNSLG